MPKVSPIRTSFNAGEWSPRLDGRVDLGKYQNSCRLLENFIPLIHGGIERRAGTRFISEVKESDKQARLIPFQFSVTQAYMFEFGDQHIRFYKDEGLIVAARTITGAVDNGGGLIRITAVGHDFATGTIVTITGVLGTIEANGTFTITVIGADTFDLQGSVFLNAYSAGGSAAFDGIETPYLETELFGIKFVQSADVMYFVHPNHIQKKLLRTSDTNWALIDLDLQDGPYLPDNDTAITITPSGTVGTITLTASASLFKSTDVNRSVRIKNGAGDWGWFIITVFTTDVLVTAEVQEPAGTGAQERWRLGLYGTENGFAAAIAFTDDRLSFAGTPGTPQRIDCSVVGDFENFRPTQLDNTVLDDDALSFTLLANDVNVIRWLHDDERGLFAGSVGGEWLISSSTGGPLTPTNIRAKRSTTSGSADIQAVRGGKAVLFIQRSGRKLHELLFDFDVDGFQNPDLTVLSERITEGGLKDIFFQKQPTALLWCVKTNGELISFTYERTEDVTAWHRHPIGGFFDAGKTVRAKVESVSVIPSINEDFDQLWMIVNRNVDGSNVRYIETLQNMDEVDDQEDLFYVDSGLTFDGAPSTVISGLDHLEGETVVILADGATHPDKIVSSGSITLDLPASVVHVGLEYKSRVITSRLNEGAADGTAQGKIKRIHNLTLRMHESLGGFIGPNFDNLDELQFRDSANPMDAPPPLFTGDLFSYFRDGYSKDGIIAIEQVQPLPMTILSLMPQLNVQDR